MTRRVKLQPTQPFFIQCTARSGSVWLASLLNGHPDIEVEGETLHPDISEGMFYAEIYSRISVDNKYLSPFNQRFALEEYVRERCKNSDRQCYGFNLKLEQLYYNPALTPAIYIPERKFIILHRLNLLKQVISELVMYKRISSGELEVHGNTPKPLTSVTVNPDAVVASMRQKHALTRQYRKLAEDSGAPWVIVSYEELTGAHSQSYLDGLLDFLGVRRQLLSSDLVKQNQYPVWELVENWHDLYRAVRTSEFAYTTFLPS